MPRLVDQRSLARSRTIRTACGSKDISLRGARRRDRRHRRRRRQRPGRIVRRAVGRAAVAEPGAVVIDGNAAGQLAITERRRLGAAFVPEERLGHGAAPRMKLSENALLTRHAASGMVQRGFIDNARDARASSIASPRPSTCARPSAIRKRVSLSGGNLQKFIVGREILREPGVLVVSQPTWGVDAGAARRHPPGADRSCRPRRGGAGHQPGPRRAFEIADRIAVMFHGRLSAPLACARSDAREDRPADGRRSLASTTGASGTACSWCLRRRAERSGADRAGRRR